MSDRTKALSLASIAGVVEDQVVVEYVLGERASDGDEADHIVHQLASEVLLSRTQDRGLTDDERHALEALCHFVRHTLTSDEVRIYHTACRTVEKLTGISLTNRKV